MRAMFGACANVYAPDDGRVVAGDHGCGAHSEVLVEQIIEVDEAPTIYDDAEVEPVATTLESEPEAVALESEPEPILLETFTPATNESVEPIMPEPASDHDPDQDPEQS
jgi:hypothetical protein